jgi:hypothetical protein
LVNVNNCWVKEYGSACWATSKELKKFADSENEDNNLIFSEDVKMSLTTKAKEVIEKIPENEVEELCFTVESLYGDVENYPSYF